MSPYQRDLTERTQSNYIRIQFGVILLGQVSSIGFMRHPGLILMTHVP